MNGISSLNTTRDYAAYASFAAAPFGGSQVGVISDAAGIPAGVRQRIAVELGSPATCFVDEVSQTAIKAQFFSTVTELPMCGHGTIGLMTRAVEKGWFDLTSVDDIDVSLDLPKTPTTVRLRLNADGRPQVMVKIAPAAVGGLDFDHDRLAHILGVTTAQFDCDLPIEVAAGDFTHLVVPMRDLAAIREITPDFGPIITFCHELDIHTIAVFSTETERVDSTIRVRDFCPAVGVAESAAAGTTNAALTSYLVRHAMVRPDNDGRTSVVAEQGMEIGRASRIQSDVEIDGSSIQSLRVGGTADKIIDGSFVLPS